MEYSWNGSDRGKPKYSKGRSAAALESNLELRRGRPVWAALRSGISIPVKNYCPWYCIQNAQSYVQW